MIHLAWYISSISWLDIWQHAVSVLFWGILWALLGMFVLFHFIKGLYPKSVFKPVSFVIALVLLVVLSYQSVLICGAVKVKSLMTELAVSVQGSIPDSWKLEQRRDATADYQRLMTNMGEDYAWLSQYIHWEDLQDVAVDDVAAVLTNEINHSLNTFIVRRVAWILLFVLLGTFALVRSSKTRSTDWHSRRSLTSSRRFHDHF